MFFGKFKDERAITMVASDCGPSLTQPVLYDVTPSYEKINLIHDLFWETDQLTDPWTDQAQLYTPSKL